MKLLGPYIPTLSEFYYQELLQLLQSALSQGDFANNSAFDEAAASNLLAQSQDFTNLPLPSAGQRVSDESLNSPLALLAARFTAMASETDNFLSQAEALLAVLEKDSALLDQLLAAASLEAWADQRPKLTGGVRYQWDFGMGNGPTARVTDIAPIDPTNLVDYPDEVPTGTRVDLTTGEVETGLQSPATLVERAVKNLAWSFASTAENEVLYGDDWTKLTLLEEHPVIQFTDSPHVEVLLPPTTATSTVPFDVSGSILGGSLPIYVRVLFTPRRSDLDLVAYNALINPSFEDQDVGWNLGAGWAIATNELVHGAGCTSCSHGTPDGILSSSLVAVNGLDKVYVEAYYQTTAGTDGTLQFDVALLKADGTPVLDGLGNPRVISLPQALPQTTWQLLNAVVTIPDVPGVAFIKLVFTITGQTTGLWYIDDTRIHIPIRLSGYQVPVDQVTVYNDATVFLEGEDQNFVVSDNGEITLLGMTDAQVYHARFTEYFPSYQCSVNNLVWSPLIMLDPAHPYPDDTVEFTPIALGTDDQGNRTLFPITDELGNATGMFLRLNQPILRSEYLLLVTTPVAAGSLPGDAAELEIDFGRVTYMNGLNLEPFSTYPMSLQSVTAEDFTPDTRQDLYSGSVLLDRPLTLSFPRRLVRKIRLTLFQENYAFKQHVVNLADAQRRSIISRLQVVLPLSVQRVPPPLPLQLTGAQYEFGLETISGQDAQPILPGVFPAGPFTFFGIPEIIRLDAEVRGQVDIYLCFRAFDANQVEVDLDIEGAPRDPTSNASLPFLPGTSIVFPFANTLDRSQVAKTQVYLRFVSRSPDALVERFLLQVTHR